MKKSLIALAVLAASGAAMAQSSVTLYGVADLSLAKASGSSMQMSGNGVLNNGNSRLGVRGVKIWAVVLRLPSTSNKASTLKMAVPIRLAPILRFLAERLPILL